MLTRVTSDSAPVSRPAISTGLPRRNRGIETFGRRPSPASTAWFVALETERRRKVSNDHDAHAELGGSTKLSVTDNRPGVGGDGCSLAPLVCWVHVKSN